MLVLVLHSLTNSKWAHTNWNPVRSTVSQVVLSQIKTSENHKNYGVEQKICKTRCGSKLGPNVILFFVGLSL
jgi:hypothetical protein